MEKVTPKTTAAAKEDKGLSPVPFSLRKKEKHTTKQLPKAIRCESSEELVPATREDGITVIGYNYPSPPMSPSELEKKEKERIVEDEKLEKFWTD